MAVLSFRPAEKFRKADINGYDVINIPLVRIVETEGVKLPELTEFDGIAFTSATAARLFFRNYHEIDDKLALFSIGESTTKQLMEYTKEPFTCRNSDSHGFAAFIADHKPKRILIPRGRTHSPTLNDELESIGISSVNLYLYEYEQLGQSLRIRDALKNERIPLVFTSSLEVRLFNGITEGKFVNNPSYPIGNTTNDTLKEYGYKNIHFEEKRNYRELIEFIFSK